jgi:hypothetical protein
LRSLKLQATPGAMDKAEWDLKPGCLIAQGIANVLASHDLRLVVLLSDVEVLWNMDELWQEANSNTSWYSICCEDQLFVKNLLGNKSDWALHGLCTGVASSSSFAPPEEFQALCTDTEFVGGGRPDDMDMAMEAARMTGLPLWIAGSMLAKYGGRPGYLLAQMCRFAADQNDIDSLAAFMHGDSTIDDDHQGWLGVIMKALRTKNAAWVHGSLASRLWSGAIAPVSGEEVRQALRSRIGSSYAPSIDPSIDRVIMNWCDAGLLIPQWYPGGQVFSTFPSCIDDKVFFFPPTAQALVSTVSMPFSAR